MQAIPFYNYFIFGFLQKFQNFGQEGGKLQKL